jgi:hypothetical protein
MNKKMNKKNIILIACFVGIALVSFYIGTKIPKKGLEFSKNLNVSRGQMGGQFQGNIKTNGGNIFGKIIAKDENSVTVEITKPNNQDNTKTDTGIGSKIIFYTDTTNITNTTSGTISDLSIGKNININGEANSDGSINATSIQIR